jgi:hypothetical protein
MDGKLVLCVQLLSCVYIRYACYKTDLNFVLFYIKNVLEFLYTFFADDRQVAGT